MQPRVRSRYDLDRIFGKKELSIANRHQGCLLLEDIWVHAGSYDDVHFFFYFFTGALSVTGLRIRDRHRWRPLRGTEIFYDHLMDEALQPQE